MDDKAFRELVGGLEISQSPSTESAATPPNTPTVPETPGPAQRKKKVVGAAPKTKKEKVTPFAMVYEVRRDFPKPPPPPQVVLEDGWTLFFGNEFGVVGTKQTHLNIRNQFDATMGGAIPAAMYNCFLEGVLRLTRGFFFQLFFAYTIQDGSGKTFDLNLKSSF